MDMNAKEFAKANAKVQKNELDKCANTQREREKEREKKRERAHAEYVFK